MTKLLSLHDSEFITSNMLLNPTIVADIYQIVKNAGTNTVERLSKEGMHQQQSVLPPYVKGVTRMTTSSTQTTNYVVYYHPKHLTIVGGVAILLYESQWNVDTLASKEIERICKKTADIDINWWPVVFQTDKVIVSESRDIMRLVELLVEELNDQCCDNNI